MNRYLESVSKLAKGDGRKEILQAVALNDDATALSELEALADGAEKAEALFYIGIVHLRAENGTDAEVAFRAAAREGFEDETALVINLALAMYHANARPAAEQLLLKTIEQGHLKPASMLWEYLAVIRFWVQNYDGSDAAFYRASLYQSNSIEPALRRAWFYLDESDHQRAIDVLERVSRKRTDPKIDFARALAHIDVEFDRAMDYLERAIEADPNLASTAAADPRFSLLLESLL